MLVLLRRGAALPIDGPGMQVLAEYKVCPCEMGAQLVDGIEYVCACDRGDVTQTDYQAAWRAVEEAIETGHCVFEESAHEVRDHPGQG